MDLSLNGKRAMVCGSTQGIGKASAIELALLGAHVTLVARDEEKLKVVRQQLPSSGTQNHEYIVVDFNFPDQLKTKIGDYGEKNTVHILVNNTGGPPAGPAMDAGLEEFTSAFSAHLLCNHILVQALIAGMKRE